MAASQPRTRRRRRLRRGTLDRPVNGRLYRSAFALVLPPLLLVAFTVTRPGPLEKPPLPAAFDTAAALTVARDLSSQYPDRAPGTAGSLGAASWFSAQLTPYGFRTTASSWRETVPGLGDVKLTNVSAVVQGQSSNVIVVMAHRDDTGAGPGADDNASGTAALIELARGYAQPHGEASVQSAHTVVFLSTDGGSFGGLGAVHFLDTSKYRDRIAAVINLDAIAGGSKPSLELAGDRPGSPNASFVATAAARVAEQTGIQPLHTGFIGQLIDLAFPLTLYEQGPFVARGVPAVTLTTGGDRPPPAFGDNAAGLDTVRFARLGDAAQQLLGSLNQGLELGPSPGSYVWAGGRLIRGWAIEFVLVALLMPFLIAVVDLYALSRRHGVVIAPAVRALRSRLGYWVFAGVVFTCFRLLGAWTPGPARPPDPATGIAGDWPVLTLLGMLVVLLLAWLAPRQRLVPRRPIAAEEQLAGYLAGLIALSLLALLVVATNPFALIFVLPSLHLWLWLPQIRIARAPIRLVLFIAGLAGPAIVLVSLAVRFQLGFDAPWYLLELVAVGYVKTLTFALALFATAAAAQLATLAAGRYAPYPDVDERRPRGPLRNLVRAIVLSRRRRRHRERRLRAPTTDALGPR